MNTDKQGEQRDRSRRGSRPKPEFQTIPEDLWRVRVLSINEFEYCSPPKGMTLSRGDFVVVSTRYGMDLGRVLGPVNTYSNIDVNLIRRIIRIATDSDLARRERLANEEESAFNICRGRIEAFGLPMKLIKAHYVLNGNKVVFFFTADNRVDFRVLVQDLADYFKMRIELRQVGLRDSSRVIGGVAVCGRPYCCHGMTDKLSPVTIKMAKEQNLSLNSLKISGACGRLLCCLAFEHDHYAAERKLLPAQGSSIVLEGVLYKVAEVHVFTSSVLLHGSEGQVMEVPASRLVRKHGRWSIRPEDMGEKVTEESRSP